MNESPGAILQALYSYFVEGYRIKPFMMIIESQTSLADDNWKPKNFSLGVLPPFVYSLIKNGRKGYAGSPRMQIGTEFH